MRHSFSAAAVALAGGALLLAGPAAAAVPVSGGINMVANATLAGTTVSDPYMASWTGTPASLAGSVSATSHAGDDHVTTSGVENAYWTDADDGGVDFSRYGWTFRVATPAHAPAEADLTQGRGGADWSYTFTATANGVFSMNYLVYDVSGNPFGLWGWGIGWNGPGGGLPLPSSAGDDPATSGVFVRPLIAGQTYTVMLDGNPNISLGSPTAGYSGYMGAYYTWSIANVPEPGSWALMVLGVAGMGWSSRDRRRGAVV